MSKEGTFLVYCMERYRYVKKLSGAEVAELFDKFKIYDYIFQYFEALHTMGEQRIVQDIDEYITKDFALNDDMLKADKGDI